MTATDTDETQIIAAPRAGGKTTALVHWVCEGQKLNGWPGWSRLLLVSNPDIREWIIRKFADEDFALRSQFPLGLGPLVLTYNQWRQSRGRNRAGLEIAVDDADELIFQALGAPPTVIALTGRFAKL